MDDLAFTSTMAIASVESMSVDSSSSDMSDCKSPAKKVKKFALPDPLDSAFELEEEVMQSFTSGDCNLAQLQLCKVPDGIPLETLSSLTISENRLRHLPPELFAGQNCINLVRFSANSNELKEVPASLFSRPKLEVLLLDHNNITALPLKTVLSSTEKLLPSVRRIGLEFNKLKEFPIQFFEHCANLEEIYLGQNDNMLDNPVPMKRFLASPIPFTLARRGDSPARLLLKLDNRPRLLQQMEEEKWSVTIPWVNVHLHKIYPDQVLGFLFLGSLRTAQTVTVYRDFNIGFILTVARGLEVKVEPGMRHLVLSIDDLPREDLRPHFNEAFTFIDEAKKEGKGVLLHCFAGLSRSVTVAAAYIMNRYDKTRDEAMDLIRAARPAAQPNEGFMAMLSEYEEQLRLDKTNGRTAEE